jgi:predicted nuclease of restriction endonuclease-like (RecB) superfamily
MTLLPTLEGYPDFLNALKQRISSAQIRAALAVSRELLELYWQIGNDLEVAISAKAWGTKVLDQVARDLKSSYPDVDGFSRRNLYRMRAFYLAYPDLSAFVPQAVAQMPWGHNVILLEKLKNTQERLWYAQKTLEHGWSRAILTLQIESNLIARQGAAVTNFAHTLPPIQSDLATQILKDPYNFDFLTLAKDALERDLERGLLEHLKSFMLELGVGFSFVGSQYPLEVHGKDYRLDLLFYHFKLHCFVVIDLKMTEFKPEYAGKMNFYLSAVDDLLRSEGDAPTIGMILCKGKDRADVEYALRGITQPMGISSFQLTQLTETLPQFLEGILPTVAELEAELARMETKESLNHEDTQK